MITPDGGTLIVGETVAARYTQFTIAEDGSLTDRTVWGQIEPEPSFESFEQTLAELKFAPDGCALDAEGCIWSADAVGGRAARLAPGGEIVDVVHGPEGLGVFACMLGGEDGRTLLICAAPDFLEHRRMDKREAVLLTTTVDVPRGRPRRRVAGSVRRRRARRGAAARRPARAGRGPRGRRRARARARRRPGSR